MEQLILPGYPAIIIAMAVAVAFFVGIVKGLVGFGMPMLLISGLSLFLSPHIALAGLIAPTVVTNGWQAFSEGPRAAWDSVKRFKLFLTVGAIALIASSQLVRVLPQHIFMGALGAVIVLFTIFLMRGWQIHADSRGKSKLEVLLALVAGASGGISGVWGPPTVAYLTAINTPKMEHVRIQGVIYGLGAILLVFAHTASGVLNASTIGLSLALVPSSLLGMWAGRQMLGRVSASGFRKATLFILLLAGLNLLRRAFF